MGVSGAHDSSAGLKAFMERHPEVLEKTVLAINIEHPSAIMSSFRGALRFGTQVAPADLVASNADVPKTVAVSNGNPLLISFFREAIDRYGIIADSAVTRRATGAATALAAAGHTVIQAYEGGFWYHSTGDRRDAINPAGLQRVTRFFAYLLDRIDRAGSAELARGRPEARASGRLLVARHAVAGGRARIERARDVIVGERRPPSPKVGQILDRVVVRPVNPQIGDGPGYFVDHQHPR
jgi:hypothetical protein